MRLKQFCLSIVFLVGLATVSGAQTMGTLTENSVSMDVKAAVAVLGDGPALTVYSPPFQPTPEETAQLQGRRDHVAAAQSLARRQEVEERDALRTLQARLGMHPEAAGDTKNGHRVRPQLQRRDGRQQPQRQQVRLMTFPWTLTGALKEGQEVAVTSKGSETFSKSTLAWDLKLKSKVLAAKKK